MSASVRNAKRRGSTIYLTVDADVEIYPDEVLDQLSDDDLLEEIKKRNLSAKAKHIEPLQDFAEEILSALRSRDYEEAELLLERILHPKFSTIALCEAEFKKLQGVA